MRFKIVHLLLFFPAYFFAMELARSAVESAVRRPWQSTLDNVHSLDEGWWKLFHFDNDPPSSIELDEWLANTSDVQHDRWGKPFRCVERNDDTSTRLGFYSCGEDGVSNSGGNDPDDLNSWDPRCGMLYEQRVDHEIRAKSALMGLFYAPFLYLPLLGVVLAAQWFYRTFQRRPELVKAKTPPVRHRPRPTHSLTVVSLRSCARHPAHEIAASG